MASALILGLTLALQAAQPDTLLVRANLPASGHPTLSLTEEVRIGTLDGPAESTFGWVDAIAVDVLERLYVADVQVPAIRVFDRNGGYIRDLGRHGEGPGEFRAIRGLAALHGGGIAVWHEMDQLSVFDTSGTFSHRFGMRFAAIAGGPGPGVIADTAGHVLVRTVTGVPHPDAPPVARYAWVHYTADGELIDSVIPPDRRADGTLPAFRTETLSAPSPHEYLVVGRNSEYALHRRLRDGRILRIERPYEAVPIEGEERAQWESYVAEWYERRGQSAPPLPGTKPPWKQLYVDADGRIWVLRYSEAQHQSNDASDVDELDWPTIDWVELHRYDVLDPRGSFLGSVTLPAGSDILFARGTRVWVLERGAYDEPYVVRYAVEGLTERAEP